MSCYDWNLLSLHVAVMARLVCVGDASSCFFWTRIMTKRMAWRYHYVVHYHQTISPVDVVMVTIAMS